jgi:hypothetical protein
MAININKIKRIKSERGLYITIAELIRKKAYTAPEIGKAIGCTTKQAWGAIRQYKVKGRYGILRQKKVNDVMHYWLD